MSARFVGMLVLANLVFGGIAQAHPGHGPDGGSNHWHHYVTSPFHLILAFLLSGAGALIVRQFLLQKSRRAVAVRESLSAASRQIHGSVE